MKAAAQPPESISVSQYGADQHLAPGIVFRIYHWGSVAPMIAHIVKFDLTTAALRFEVSRGDRSGGMEYVAMRTSDYLERSGGVLAVNASYFLPFAGGSPGGDDYYPRNGDPLNASGAVRALGRAVSPIETDLDIRINAAVCFSRALIEIVDGQDCPKTYSDSVATGPRILAKGEERSYLRYDNRYATGLRPLSWSAKTRTSPNPMPAMLKPD